MDQELLDNIKEIKEAYQDSDSIENIEKSLKLCLQGQKVKEIPFVKYLLGDLKRKLENINNELLNNENLSDKERDKMFARKECWSWVLKKFELVDSTPQVLKKEIERLKKSKDLLNY